MRSGVTICDFSCFWSLLHKSTSIIVVKNLEINIYCFFLLLNSFLYVNYHRYLWNARMHLASHHEQDIIARSIRQRNCRSKYACAPHDTLCHSTRQLCYSTNAGLNVVRSFDRHALIPVSNARPPSSLLVILIRQVAQFMRGV